MQMSHLSNPIGGQALAEDTLARATLIVSTSTGTVGGGYPEV